MEALARGGSAHPARNAAAESAAQDKKAIQRPQKADGGQGMRGHRLRDGRRTRGRADFPQHLPDGGLQKTGAQAVDFQHDGRIHPRRFRRDEADGRLRRALSQRALPQRSRLACRHERQPRFYAALRRAAFHRPRADADAGAARSAAARNRSLHAEGLLDADRVLRRLRGPVAQRTDKGKKADRRRAGGSHRRKSERQARPRRAHPARNEARAFA